MEKLHLTLRRGTATARHGVSRSVSSPSSRARPDAELPPSLCDPDAVAMLVERARNGAGSTDEMCGLAARVFWSFVISHVPDPASALVKLRVAERISLYEPLLRERASELFGAQFDDAMLAPGDDGEQDDGDFADPP